MPHIFYLQFLSCAKFFTYSATSHSEKNIVYLESLTHFNLAMIAYISGKMVIEIFRYSDFSWDLANKDLQLDTTIMWIFQSRVEGLDN